MGQRMHCSPSDRKRKEANNDNTYNGMTYSQWINNPHDNPKVINLTGHGKQGRQETWRGGKILLTVPRLSGHLKNIVTDWNWGKKSHEYLGPGLQPRPPGSVLSPLANTLVSIRHAQSNLNHIYFWV